MRCCSFLISGPSLTAAPVGSFLPCKACRMRLQVHAAFFRGHFLSSPRPTLQTTHRHELHCCLPSRPGGLVNFLHQVTPSSPFIISDEPASLCPHSSKNLPSHPHLRRHSFLFSAVAGAASFIHCTPLWRVSWMVHISAGPGSCLWWRSVDPPMCEAARHPLQPVQPFSPLPFIVDVTMSSCYHCRG